MLGSGATEIRKANYATKGVYFQAFTSLFTGIERIGKLCLMLDHALAHGGQYPDAKYMREEICHKISLIYEKSASVVTRRSLKMEFLQNLNGVIHQGILHVLSEFAQGDRYCNINLLVGGKGNNDSIEMWFTRVDEPLYNSQVRNKRKQTIRRNAQAVSEILGTSVMVRHTSETGTEITDLEEASYRTGMYEAVAPLRQLHMLQVIRYWVELLDSLEHSARLAGLDVPYFGEILARFYNPDSYLRTKKTWERT